MGKRAKFTKPEVGQCPFGGWSAEGKRKYGALRDANKTARTKKATIDKEKAILRALKTEYGHDFTTYQQYLKSKGQKTPAATKVTEEIAELDVDNWDD